MPRKKYRIDVSGFFSASLMVILALDKGLGLLSFLLFGQSELCGKSGSQAPCCIVAKCCACPFLTTELGIHGEKLYHDLHFC